LVLTAAAVQEEQETQEQKRRSRPEEDQPETYLRAIEEAKAARDQVPAPMLSVAAAEGVGGG
jgi:hypothetical protein